MLVAVLTLLCIISLSEAYIAGPSRISSRGLATVLNAKRRTTLSRGRGLEGPKETEESRIPDAVVSPVSSSEERMSIKSISAAASSSVSEMSSTPAVAAPMNKGRQLSQRIQDDISDFERIGALKEKKVVVEENGVGKTLKDIFSAVFIADFFVVIFFLVWFLAAAVMQKTDPFLLEKFQDIFQPVVVPSLTVLMVGSMASGAMEEQANKNKSKP